MRLPTLLMGLACWWVISREVIPRLGHAVKTSRAAAWTAAGMFLAFWLPLEQRAAPRTDHRAGHPADLVLGRARRGDQPAAASGVAIIIGALTLFSGPDRASPSVGALLVAVGPLKTIVRRHVSTVRLLRAAGSDRRRGHRHHRS